MTNASPDAPYPVRFDVDYPEQLDRLSTFFRLLFLIPIAIVYLLIAGGGSGADTTSDDGAVRTAGLTTTAGIAFATALMILFRQKYPRWWFDFSLELARFGARLSAYGALLRDEYPSTDEAQAVHLEIDYPEATQLNRVLPFVKWLLALPHYIVLAVLLLGAFFAIVIAWFAIVVTGRYPRGLFDYVVGVQRWCERVAGYMFLLVTDRYPPFSLK